MRRDRSIPVNPMAREFGEGVAVERTYFTSAQLLSEEAGSHRHDSHSFFLLESGSISVEIDFKTYTLTAPSVMYVHPDQVHRTAAAADITVSSWSLTNENLDPKYLALLEDITPAEPLSLDKDTFLMMTEAVSLCLKFSERKGDKLYRYMLKDGCNAMVAIIASQYLAQAKPADRLSRPETITRAFRKLLERSYTTFKRPSAYARELNISTAYLNECVKSTTGHPVTHHLQQRVVLEAKRLLYYSDRSVKEISADLGFDDYPYFSRLFTKITGTTALSFRVKNRG